MIDKELRKTVLRLFVEFLLKQGIYLQTLPKMTVRHNNSEGKDIPDIIIMDITKIQEVNNNDFIMQCFRWAETDEGECFWHEVCNSWWDYYMEIIYKKPENQWHEAEDIT